MKILQLLMNLKNLKINIFSLLNYFKSKLVFFIILGFLGYIGYMHYKYISEMNSLKEKIEQKNSIIEKQKLKINNLTVELKIKEQELKNKSFENKFLSKKEKLTKELKQIEMENKNEEINDSIGSHTIILP